MPDRLFLKPAEGVRVPKPQGGVLPPEGDHVNSDSYWLRRIADGDVSEAKPPAAPAADPATTTDTAPSTTKRKAA